MATRKKLTVAGIKTLRPPSAGRKEYLDTVVPQLALRVTDKGVKSFAVRTRVKGTGKQIRVTLGEFPAIGLGEARDAARDALNAARRGINPTEEKRREARAQRDLQTNTFGGVSKTFIHRYAKKNKTWSETQRILD